MLLLQGLALHVLMSILFTAACVQGSKEDEEKCTPNDSRKCFPKCMQGSDLTLWCDYSNFTEVPDPDKIYDGRSCRDSTALFLNDSCIEDIGNGYLGEYAELRVLEFGRNRITTIRKDAFKSNTKLETINLHTNYIEQIEQGAFEGLHNVKFLDIGNNLLKNVEPEMFKGLRSLRMLSLHNNLIGIVKSGTFASLHSLEILILTGNEIHTVEENAFNGLKRLRSLHLDGNKITLLSSTLLKTMPKLEVLTVSYNHLRSWPKFEHKAAHIVSLNFAHNKIGKIEVSDLEKLPKLQNLNLEHNNLSSLPADLFKHNHHLRFVDFSNNALEQIERQVFIRSCHLEVLKLSNNRLKNIYVEWFQWIARNEFGEASDLGGNEWICNCHASRLKNLTLRRPDFHNALNFSCSTIDKDLTDDTCEEQDKRHLRLKCNATKSFHRAKRIVAYDPASVEKRTPPGSSHSSLSIIIYVMAAVMLILVVASLVKTRLRRIQRAKHPNRRKQSQERYEKKGRSYYSEEEGIFQHGKNEDINGNSK